MRRTVIALTALATLVIALGASGSGALAISSGPLSASPDTISFGHVAQVNQQTVTETLTNDSPTSTTLKIQSDPLNGPTGDFTSGQRQLQQRQAEPRRHVHGRRHASRRGRTAARPPRSTSPTTTPPTATTQSIDLGGTGVATQFSLSGPIDFGDQRVGTTSGVQTEIVTNNTDYNANPTGPSDLRRFQRHRVRRHRPRSEQCP